MKDTKKRTEILIPRGVVKALTEELGLSERTVTTAIKGATRSENADKVRYLALNKYGGNYRRD